MPRERDDAPWMAGTARVRKVRGPRADGCWYWRAIVRDPEAPTGERLVWAGWARRRDPMTSQEIITAAGKPPEREADAGALPTPTVKGLLGAWRAEQEARVKEGNLRQRSMDIYAGCCRHISRRIGGVLLDQLDRDALREYARIRRLPWTDENGEHPGASTQTVKQELDVVSWAWTWGRRLGHAPDRDLELPEITVKPVREKYTPTHAEVLAVLERLSGWSRVAVALLYGTGARIGEVARLTWAAVDLERGVITLDGKTGPRVVPISTDLVRELRVVGPRAATDTVVPTSPATTTSRLLDILERATQDVGVPRFTPHGLRRLAVDTMYEAGEDVGVVAHILGQSPTVALAHYRQARPEALRKAMDRAKLGRIPEGRVLALPVTGGRNSDEE